MILFNKAAQTGCESQYIAKALQSNHISGDGYFSKSCQQWFEERLPSQKAVLTPSCTAALELAAILIDIKPGDEIIMPSYTFVSTANAFVLRGATIVFVDIRPDTMNIDETLIEAAVTERTKAIVPVHYGGVACEMDVILDVANRHDLFVIEDAAQCMMSSYKNKALGTFGNFGAFSFHETKNYTSGGEGGLLIINDHRFIQRAEIIREKGTNRNQFFRGMVDKYQWVDIGSSYLLSELQAAFLWAQLENAEKINEARLKVWRKYQAELAGLQMRGLIDLPTIPEYCTHNAHMFYIKVSNLEERSALIEFLKEQNIMAVFHYVPLHTATAGLQYGRFHGQDKHTTSSSERLLRLPLWFGISDKEQTQVISAVTKFYS